MGHIYVSNLQFSATKDEIQELFRTYGQVYRITLLRDAAPGRRRLFALVEMPNDAESARAIAALNGFELGGRHLRISGGLSLGAPLRAESATTTKGEPVEAVSMA